MPDDLEQPSQLSQRTVSLLKDIYLHSDVVQLQRIANNISKKAATLKCNTVLSTEQMWSEKDAVLITYPDNIMDHSLGPLESLKTFVEKYFLFTSIFFYKLNIQINREDIFWFSTVFSSRLPQKN